MAEPKNISPRADGLDNLGRDNKAWGDIYGKRIHAKESCAVTGTMSVGKSVTVGGDLTVTGNATVSSSAIIAGDVTANGTITATKVFNAVYNDYAEYFDRGEETEAGDIIALDMKSEKEQYVRATDKSLVVVGVQSDCYAQVIGGESTDDEDFEMHNIKKFIPVALAGRVGVKVKGKVWRGDFIVPSDTPGIGKASTKNTADAVGIALEQNLDCGVKRVKMLVTR